MVVRYKINDDKIASAICNYKKYLELLEHSPKTDDDCDTLECLWDTWYNDASLIVDDKPSFYTCSLILGANEDYLSVEAIHNCIEILGMNVEINDDV